jgi:hypothetical protein
VGCLREKKFPFFIRGLHSRPEPEGLEGKQPTGNPSATNKHRFPLTGGPAAFAAKKNVKRELSFFLAAARAAGRSPKGSKGGRTNTLKAPEYPTKQ